jgi:hypothetical protein
MIAPTPFSVSLNTIERALAEFPLSDEFRISINKPTGNFFYDSWELKDEYKGTPWQEIYDSLDVVTKGEARVIKLDGAKCYYSHADIDDRYHLNLCGTKHYLVDLDTEVMHHVETDGKWHMMDAGRRHSAVNFSIKPRYQLVVRKLLQRNELQNPVRVTIGSHLPPNEARFLFDDGLSCWLSFADKWSLIANFEFKKEVPSFDIERDHLGTLERLIQPNFFII